MVKIKAKFYKEVIKFKKNRRTFSQERFDSSFEKSCVEGKVIVERTDLGISPGNINSKDKEEIFHFPDWRKMIIYEGKRKTKIRLIISFNNSIA